MRRWFRDRRPLPTLRSDASPLFPGYSGKCILSVVVRKGKHSKWGQQILSYLLECCEVDCESRCDSPNTAMRRISFGLHGFSKIVWKRFIHMTWSVRRKKFCFMFLCVLALAICIFHLSWNQTTHSLRTIIKYYNVYLLNFGTDELY